MKKPVLIGASLVLATSILGACGKESSTAASGGDNQNITQSQVSNVTINGKALNEKEIEQYKKEYMQDSYKKLNRDTQSVIKNMVLKEALMKDLNVTDKQIDEEVQTNIEQSKKYKLKPATKSFILHSALAKGYSLKYLNNEKTVNEVTDTLKGKEKEDFITNYASALKAHRDDIYTANLIQNYYMLYYVADKNKVVDVKAYQQDLLNNADVKGIKLSKLKSDETIF